MNNKYIKPQTEQIKEDVLQTMCSASWAGPPPWNSTSEENSCTTSEDDFVW